MIGTHCLSGCHIRDRAGSIDRQPKSHQLNPRGDTEGV